MNDIARYRVPVIGKAKLDAQGEFVRFKDHQAAMTEHQSRIAAEVPHAQCTLSEKLRRCRPKGKAVMKRRVAGPGAFNVTGEVLWK